MRTLRLPVATLVLATLSTAAVAQRPSPASTAIPVTVDNFVRAESDVYLAGIAKDYGFGKIGHNRAPAPIDNPVDGFWSASLYDAEGYYQKNPYDAYTLNNITAKNGADGSIAIQLGGCDGKIPNCLPVMPGSNHTVRLYRPRAEILDGTWKFPEPQPVQWEP